MQAEHELNKHRWNSREYLQAAELGWFNHKRVELIEGDVIYMSAMSVNHFQGMVKADKLLQKIFTGDFFVSAQCPIAVNGISEPEPDVAVIAGQPEDYKNALPKTAALVVEVADTSLQYDRTQKASLYAKANVPDYWIVNVKDRRLEVRRRPIEDIKAVYGFLYEDVSIFTERDTVSPLAKPDARIAVADLLP